jgi:hypothetical protein
MIYETHANRPNWMILEKSDDPEKKMDVFVFVVIEEASSSTFVVVFVFLGTMEALHFISGYILFQFSWELNGVNMNVS